MSFTATFRFHDSLNDFLRGKQRDQPISYAFNNAPAIKDAIEAIGIPHTEVAVILVDDVPVDFYYQLQDIDQVEVFPPNKENKLKSLQHPLPNPVKFVLDVHLGKLAKALRLLGFDTCYENNYDDKTIVRIAETDVRVILTRDIGLLKHKTIKWGYWLRSQHLKVQLKEVLKQFDVSSYINTFTRCLECNNNIFPVNKETVLDKLPPKTIEYFNEFYQCVSCKRVYWKGSHYDNMVKFIEELSIKD